MNDRTPQSTCIDVVLSRGLRVVASGSPTNRRPEGDLSKLASGRRVITDWSPIGCWCLSQGVTGADQ